MTNPIQVKVTPVYLSDTEEEDEIKCDKDEEKCAFSSSPNTPLIPVGFAIRRSPAFTPEQIAYIKHQLLLQKSKEKKGG